MNQITTTGIIKDGTEVKESSNTVGEWTKGKLFCIESNGEFIRHVDNGRIMIGSDKDYIFEMYRCGEDQNEKEQEANAARIVECWNGYDKLKAENEALKEANKELLEALKECSALLSGYMTDDEYGPPANDYEKSDEFTALISKHTKS